MHTNFEGYDFADWNTGRNAEDYFSEWRGLKNPYYGPKYHKQTLLVCHSCKIIFCHTSLSYCPRCPNKFEMVDGKIEELQERFKGYKLGAQ